MIMDKILENLKIFEIVEYNIDNLKNDINSEIKDTR